MLLVVGLGNPGAEYARNRHNVGFMAADRIVRRHGFSPWRSRFQGQAAEGLIDGARALALKPQTYMNESGRSVGEAMRFHRIAPSELIVLHDELDLAAGRIRVKVGGGHAGHNGLRSIQAHVGPDFKRVRIGIGHPGEKTRVTGHVLGDFAKADAVWLEPMLEAIADFAGLLLAGKDSDFMSKVAMAAPAPRPPKEERE
ncbi:MAG: aminoacyl-tRNA hydrolase [Magnetospirillum sp. WYHS-4]